ncbi:MAG: UDP-N-acetylmuramate dehydrogenase [Beijerinckiaceae bacterium]|nr:UDP-N-acetylmuramate dehydrogenase [Beijerinckiaceae bacterium]
MSFTDITPALKSLMPELRGRLFANQDMAGLTWFRVGGPAQAMFAPDDEEDLGYFLAKLPKEVPLTLVGVGSNLIVRDGGIPGVVIRLTHKGFGHVEREDEAGIRAGTAMLDRKVAEFAEHAHLAGLEFYSGIPGSIGGALRMNAGANGFETKDVLKEARAVSRNGDIKIFRNYQMGFSYRHCDVDPQYIFTSALFQGFPDAPEAIHARMKAVQHHRETVQPIREKTGGSTFKNPKDMSAWKLIDAAGCRGLRVGGAQVSELHCNFLINTGEATAADIECLGEMVRQRVKETSGVDLQWEIKRIGVPKPGETHPDFAKWASEN